MGYYQGKGTYLISFYILSIEKGRRTREIGDDIKAEEKLDLDKSDQSAFNNLSNL